MELVIATALTAVVVLGITVMQTSANSFLNSTNAHTGFESYYIVEKLSRWVELGSAIAAQGANDEFQVRLDYDDSTSQSTSTGVRNFIPKHTATQDDDMWLSAKFFPGQGIYYIKKYNSVGNTSAPGTCPPPGPGTVIALTTNPVNALIPFCTFARNNPST